MRSPQFDDIISDTGDGGGVLCTALVSGVTLVQVVTVSVQQTLPIAIVSFVLAIVVAVSLLKVTRHDTFMMPIVVSSSVIEVSLLVSNYLAEWTTVFGLLRMLAVGDEATAIPTFLSWFVPEAVITMALSLGPRESRTWVFTVASILAALSWPLRWPPEGLFI